MSASDFIPSRPTNVTRLFNLDAGMKESELNFRQTLAELKCSLDVPTRLTHLTNDTVKATVHLARLYDPTTRLRELLPVISGRRFVLGSLPDQTFNGMVFGLSEEDWEDLFADPEVLHLKPVPVFSRIARVSDTMLWIQALAAAGRTYVLEQSYDLNTWVRETVVLSATRDLVLLVPNQAAVHAVYYRLQDRSDRVTYAGRVLDARNQQPIQGVTVRLSSGSPTTNTESDGSFLLLTDIKWYGNHFHFLNVSALGYAPGVIQGYARSEDQLRNLQALLARKP